MTLKRTWARSKKIKSRARDLFLEPDIKGYPANSLSAIAQKLRDEFGQAAEHIDADLIMKWANAPEYPYSWAELRIISQTAPAIKASPGLENVDWKEEILRKLESSEVRDRSSQELLAMTAQHSISEHLKEAKDAGENPFGLVDAIDINNITGRNLKARRSR